MRCYVGLRVSAAVRAAASGLLDARGRELLPFRRAICVRGWQDLVRSRNAHEFGHSETVELYPWLRPRCGYR